MWKKKTITQKKTVIQKKTISRDDFEVAVNFLNQERETKMQLTDNDAPAYSKMFEKALDDIEKYKKQK